MNLVQSEIPKTKLFNLSKLHFTIRRHTYSSSELYFATVEDHSKNGTFINGRSIGKNKKHVLSHNDRISIGFQKYDGEWCTMGSVYVCVRNCHMFLGSLCVVNWLFIRKKKFA